MCYSTWETKQVQVKYHDKHTRNSIKPIGRYGGLTGITLVEGVGNKFLLVGMFGLAKGRNLTI